MTVIPGISIYRRRIGAAVTHEEEMRNRIVGQDEAITAISKAVRRARAGLKGSAASNWFIYLPRPDRRRKNGADQGFGGVLVW